MKINDQIFVDIGLGSPVILDNFLGATDLINLQIIETAGSCLPIVYIAFRTYEESTARYFIQNNLVTLRIGETEEDADTFVIVVHDANPPANDNAGGSWLVEFTGFVKNRTLMTNYEAETYRGNSQMVTYQILKKYLGITAGNGYYSDILRTNENQVSWRRNNSSTPSTFVAETLVHMDIMPSFPLFCFDRYGDFYLRDFSKLAKEKPSVSFVAREATQDNEIQFINNFTVQSFKDNYNLYSGFNKVSEIYGAKTGLSYYTLSANEPILASTQESEKAEGTSRSKLNLIQSSNVHNTYVSAFVYNTNKLVALSSMSGVLELTPNKYYRNFKPTDIVDVTTMNLDKALNGRYLIDTIRIEADMKVGASLKTYVYVTRDNSNSIENYIANPKQGMKIRKKFWSDLMNAISRLKVAYATGLKIIDGTYMKQVLSFAITTKNNLLRSFTAAGVTVDFTSSSNLIQSLINVGNSLMNTLISMIFPSQIAYILRDFAIRKPSLKSLVSTYIGTYVPYEARDIVAAIVDALFETTNSLNSIAKDNGIDVTTATASNANDTTLKGDETVIDEVDTSEIDYTADSQQKINEIISDFEKNTSGLDIPFPIIELTESQSLMNDELLRNYVATETISNLTNLGYMDDVDKDEFKQILLGEEPINFNIINQINNNAGSSYNYRLWGTFGGYGNESLYAWAHEAEVVFTKTFEVKEGTRLFNSDYSPYSGDAFAIKKLENGKFVVVYITDPSTSEFVEAERMQPLDIVADDLIELTDFYIKKCYKDKYRTIPCTKLINAKNNAKIFFACPVKEQDLRFYINSKRTELPSFEMTLGYTDVYGNLIKYLVYYTEVGFNSTSVLFEVKQGGMV